MDQILKPLAGILLKSIPTVCLLLLLYFYFKAMLFKPLEQVRKQRRDLTSGKRKAADESLKDAERKVQEYENKMRDARAEVYREQETTRTQWLADQAAQVTAVRERNAVATAQAKAELAVETGAARESLTQSSGALADEIATVLLAGRNG